MNVRVGLLALLVLATGWGSEARFLVSPEDASGDLENAPGRLNICTLCEQYTVMAINYLEANETQTEIIDKLHNSCYQLHGLTDQCLRLVDVYAPLFFLELSSVQPEEFCTKVGLCKNPVLSSLSKKQNKCDLCHHAMDEVLVKLKDPDSKLEILEILLKACTAVEKYMKKCKTMVFEFAPLVLTDAEKFFENTDICTAFHACTKPKLDAAEVFKGRIEMVTSS